MFVGYYGGNGHQPRYLGSAAILLAVGTFIMSLAYFTSPIYTPRDDGFSLLCLPNSSKSLPSMETIVIDGDTVNRPLSHWLCLSKNMISGSASKSEVMTVDYYYKISFFNFPTARASTETFVEKPLFTFIFNFAEIWLETHGVLQ